jgi:hypothetical protein
MQHLRHRLPEVVAAVAQRLVNAGRIAAAADLQEGMNDVAGMSLFFVETYFPTWLC